MEVGVVFIVKKHDYRLVLVDRPVLPCFVFEVVLFPFNFELIS
jgi:hypothetical protein